jgi:hypothetical protein
VVELLAPKAYEKGIDVAWAVDPALPSPLLADEVRVRQIVTNLLGNAIKFTDGGGVLVTVRKSLITKPPSEMTTWTSPSRSRTPASASPRALPALFSEFEQADAPCAAGRAEPGSGSPYPAAWRGRWAARSWWRACPARARRSRRPAAEAALGGTAGRSSPRSAGDAQHVLLALDPASSAARCACRSRARASRWRRCAVARGSTWRAQRRGGEPFTTLIVDGRSGCERGSAAPRRCQGGGA